MKSPVCSNTLHQHARKPGSRMHLAHVAVVVVHLFCCGLPIGAALIGVAAGAGLLSVHTWLHGYELVLLAASAAVVAIGAALEWRKRRAGAYRLSPFFVASAACLAVNLAAFGAHV